MKKIIFTALLIACIALGLTGCAKKTAGTFSIEGNENYLIIPEASHMIDPSQKDDGIRFRVIDDKGQESTITVPVGNNQ